MTSPYMLTWVNPTTNTDGSALTQSDVAGYEIAIDGAAAVSVPLGYATSFDLTTLAGFSVLKSGSHTVTLAVTNKEGETGAASSAVTFPVLPKVPGVPTALAVG